MELTGLEGTLLTSEDPDYSSVLKWFIGRYQDLMPAAVARCDGPGDVAAALTFARRHELPVAIRSGAHSFAEHSSTEGLLIDLGGMRRIGIDGGVVRVGPGTRIGALAEHLAPYGLVVPFGWCPMVGAGGSALGGGFGPLGRYYGLALDQLVAAEVVLADGHLVRTDDEHEPDLFWALRGAGAAGFGVVTELSFRTRRSVPLATFGAWWSAGSAAAVVDAWQHLAPYEPPESNVELVLRTSPDPAEPLEVVLFGIVAGGDPVADLLKRFGAAVGESPDRTVVEEFSAVEAPGKHRYAGGPVEHTEVGGRPVDQDPGVRFVKSEFFAGPVPLAAVEALVAAIDIGRLPGERREIEFIPWRAALGATPPDATAFVHRDPHFMVEHTVQSFGSLTRKRTAHRWATESKAILHAHGTGHVYQNYPDPDLTDWAHAYYGSNLPRLRCIKAAYDPTGLFDGQQTIPKDLRRL